MSEHAQQFADRCAKALACLLPDVGHGPEIMTVIAGSYDAFQKVLDQQKKNKNQIPPSLNDVQAYLDEIDYGISAQAFIDHYQAKGWKISQGVRMVDWQSAVRNWKRNGWGQHKGRAGNEIKASLGALQIQYEKVCDEIRDMVRPGGSAHARLASSLSETEVERYKNLLTLRESIKARIEGGILS